jgi:hypothetical protein
MKPVSGRDMCKALERKGWTLASNALLSLRHTATPPPYRRHRLIPKDKPRRRDRPPTSFRGEPLMRILPFSEQIHDFLSASRS